MIMWPGAKVPLAAHGGRFTHRCEIKAVHSTVRKVLSSVHKVHSSGRCTPRCGSGRCTPRCGSGRCTPRCGSGRCTPRCGSGRCTPRCSPGLGAVHSTLRLGAVHSTLQPRARGGALHAAARGGALHAAARGGAFHAAHGLAAHVRGATRTSGLCDGGAEAARMRHGFCADATSTRADTVAPAREERHTCSSV
jgi:hypothetical protein